MKYEELKNALDGLMAYDIGALDSGIHDEALKARVSEYLKSLAPGDRNTLLERIATDLSSGYGQEDRDEFIEWINETFPVEGA